MVKGSFGPIPPSEFSKLAALPYGEAKTFIRKYDPLFGLAKGEKIKWRVRFEARAYGEEIVEAESLEEAEKLAKEIKPHTISFDDVDVYSAEIDIVEPA